MKRLPFSIAVSMLATLISITSPPARAAETIAVERARHLMGTTLTLTLEGENPESLNRTAERVFAEVGRLESMLSNWQSNSEVNRLNGSAGQEGVRVSGDLFEVLERSQYWATRTDGAYDAVLEPLVQAYDLRGEGRWPAADEVTLAAGHSGHDRLELDRSQRRAVLADGSGVELGGIGKGFALDRAARVLREDGVDAALLNFGGQILAIGAPEGEWGWSIDLTDPEDRSTPAMTLEIRDASIATSSQYERSLDSSRGPIGHVLDPRTGLPAKGWGAVSAVAPSATDADAISTALFVLGPEAGAEWIRDREEYSALFLEPIADEDRLVIRIAGHSPGLRIQPDDGDQASGGGAPSNAELSRRIDILSEEVEDMRQGEAAPQRSQGRFGLGPAASAVYGVKRGVSLAGYGNVVFQGFSNENQAGTPANKTNQFDLLRIVTYIGYKFTDRILFNSEIEYEHASTGKQGEVSVEFAYLDFLFREEIGIRAGMVLVPVGWINEMHEPPTYLGVHRPTTEQAIIPTTWRGNGAGVVGDFGPGFTYRAYVLEGLRSVGDSDDGIGGFSSGGIRGGRQNGSKSLVDNWAGVARLDWNSDFGLLLGGSAFSGGSAQGDSTSGGESFTGQTTILEGHAQYRGHGVWLRGLYSHADIDEAAAINSANGYTGSSSVGSKLSGWYIDAGYDIWRLWSRGGEMALYPYVRFEQVNTQEEVPSGFAANPKNDTETLTLGAQYYPISQIVVKADYQNRKNKADTGVDQFNFSLGFMY
jgi:thiamine biosynthesis lipoprotein ApbE